MTDTRGGQGNTATGAAHRSHREPEPTAWVGWIAFAGIMMFLLGTFQLIEGLVAIVNDDYFLVPGSDLVVSVDYTAWGWVHLLLGILIAGAGLGMMVGQMWARVVGVLVAAFSAIVNVAFLPAYPVWSAIIITIDILVIYALIVHGRESKPDYA